MSTITRKIVPNTKVARLTYTQAIAIDPGISAFTYITFRATSVYDPDYAVGGNQPLGYDQWSLFYPNWCVLKSTCKVQLGSADTNVAGVGAVYGCTVSNDPAIPALYTFANMVESPESSSRLAPSWGGAPLSRPAKVTYDIHKWWGIKDPQDGNILWGQTSSDPNANTYFIVWAGAVDAQSAIGAMYGMVTINYTVMFRNANMLPPS